jgi:predicted DNA-binding transcriptional regulator YafY
MANPLLVKKKKIIDRAAWVAKQESMAQKRMPKKVGIKQKTGTLFAKRNKNLAVREAALRGVMVIINYVKITTGEYKQYIVEPYEWKFRMLKTGYKKMLWAYDIDDQRIKSFLNANIQNVVITDKKYDPMWEVKIK